MKSIRVAVVLVTTIWCAAVLATTTDPDIDAELRSVAALLTDGFASLNTQHVLAKDLSVPNIGERWVVLFGMESFGGGNNSSQFLAVFVRDEFDLERAHPKTTKSVLRLVSVQPIGRDFDRWFDSIGIEGDVIVLGGRRWLPLDSHCCPSNGLTTRFKLERYGVQELPNIGTQPAESK